MYYEITKRAFLSSPRKVSSSNWSASESAGDDTSPSSGPLSMNAFGTVVPVVRFDSPPYPGLLMHCTVAGA